MASSVFRPISCLVLINCQIVSQVLMSEDKIDFYLSLLCAQLDDGVASVCTNRRATYSSLQDGNHGFEVCANGNRSFVGCASYNWTVG